MSLPHRIAIAILILAARPLRAEDRIAFNRDVRPILAEHCFACHGPDKAKRKAKLRLDERASAVEKRAIVPGKPDESEIVARVLSTDSEIVMPPVEAHKPLTAVQKGVLKRWIAEGAEYQGHWAYERPVRPPAPNGPNAIDTLAGRRLAQIGAAIEPEADRRTLIRRLFFDLLGLPPTPADVEAFLTDRSPDAYARLVDRLLANPHYGERMAIGWLDLVRFADTIGYHSDNPRNVWPYRDYVIRAFNANKPFDQFTIEQLAGDLLPGATLEQKVASCFNHLLLTTEEGGAQAKDYEVRMLADRVRAVGTVWLGQTLGCCQCHDHKFDPGTARDFYSLGAFFADIKEPIIGRREVGLAVPDERQMKELTRLQSGVIETQRRLSESSPATVAGQSAWEAAVRAEATSADRWTMLRPDKAVAERGARLSVDAEGIVTADRTSRGGIDTYTLTMTVPAGITGLRIDALAHASLPAEGPGRAANGNFVVSEVALADSSGQTVKIAHASATFEQSGFPAAATVDGKTDKANGWAVDGATGSDQAIVFELTGPLPSVGGEPDGDKPRRSLVLTLRQLHGDNHTLGRFRVSVTSSERPVRAPRVMLPPREILDVIKRDAADRDAGQRDRVATYYRRIAPELAGLRSQIAAARKAVADYEVALPHCMVSAAMPTPRTVRVRPRGNWMDDSGDVVQPAPPTYLKSIPLPTERRLSRLDLAQWLVSRDNPLTARAFVNRLWKQFFGTGLCKTLDDLGTQGEWPAHQELLDWLAVEFMESDWDAKHLVRTIVLSQTYRQAANDKQADDRLLLRQRRFRLDAELVRDNALAIAGLLSPRVGGPSAHPYQPAGYWENLNFPVREYVADQGASQYRRGLYTWWQRTFPHPNMIAFDAPSREECAADRPRSNIPQQALVLLNDPTYVEAARVFAGRIVREGGGTTSARIAWAWYQALQRPPRPDEVTTITALVDKHLREYRDDRPAAEALLKVGFAPAAAEIDVAELAAWTNAARVIL
ncbi:MAG TPA: PSD1 and planctomycete cytochrome C domain-containing protein, partial [Gemmataceae bacterium]|nr:PSD1 and planctomycete cytochrome C domain-containing protein [Gemmataceae bacterium]